MQSNKIEDNFVYGTGVCSENRYCKYEYTEKIYKELETLKEKYRILEEYSTRMEGKIEELTIKKDAILDPVRIIREIDDLEKCNRNKKYKEALGKIRQIIILEIYDNVKDLV